MLKRLGQSALLNRLRPKLSTRVGKLAWRLSLAFIVLLVLHPVSGLGTLTGILLFFIGIVLVPLLLILLWRFFTRRILWKVRNRLILTYLLMGLAPILLLSTLLGIAAYILMGQYATNTALFLLDGSNAKVSFEAMSAAAYLNVHGTQAAASLPVSDADADTSRIALAVLENGKWKSLHTSGDHTNLSPFDGQPMPEDPSWMTPNFHGAVAFHGRLYLSGVAIVLDGKRSTTVIGTLPLDTQTLNSTMKNLGQVTLSAFDFGEVKKKAAEQKDPDVDAVMAKLPANSDNPDDDENVSSLEGGKVPPPLHFWDTHVFFSAGIPVTFWRTGSQPTVRLNVHTRPTALYARLFATSTETGTVIKYVLLSIALFFAVLELFALLMAVRLSTSITRSVAELSRGTTEIDRGNLAHRIKIKRRDQLGALAGSFNAMAASITDLLIQQREKDRLVSELAIAQGVQETLFPNSPIQVGELEVHAICKPARSVSGDYFDFIGDWGGTFHHGQICLALGDISGKGISAALVMASLQSAMRALMLSDDGPLSPGQLLSQLNWHLFRSTQSNRYATLFLAFYDASTRVLTYSNGGHLPPLVLSTDGTVRRLDIGGSVVGLLDNQIYPDGTLQLHTGDLLMAFSDGLTEPENARGEFGEDRLLDCVRDNFGKPLDILAHDTIHHVLQWIGKVEQPDDMTLLLARQL
jgi:sigma-B regulation protein RsbU (phosphoserine phosphatase)